MAFQTALTIKNVIKNIEEKHYLLPSIQREFVWGPDQIERLFDSLMRDYPISSFLFWNVPKEKATEFKFYEFLRNYHEINGKHNIKANTNGNSNIVAILDGQQRLTSIYIALKGSYTYKLAYKRRDNPDAYPKRKMYLNLKKEAEEADLVYDFRFLTDKEAKKQDENHFWFPVEEILNIKEQFDVTTYLTDNDLLTVENKDEKEKVKFIHKTLTKLFNVIHVTPTISYFLEESTELDKVLNIFIRINSGGTKLSYSDLLLSFATAQWDNRDAREEINEFVDKINTIGKGFNINKDFVLKACLVLSDFPDISFKVDNFNRKNMLEIENQWEKLTDAMYKAFETVASYGFSKENIASNYIFIPIAYYIKSIDIPSNFVISKNYDEDRNKIKKWLVSSSLLKVFSFAPDAVLKPIRLLITNNPGSFPLDKIIEKFKGTTRDITFDDDNIENLLFTKYAAGDVLLVLSILYPWADLRNNFHIDHIYPKSKFTKKHLASIGLKEEDIEYYMDNVNYIGNLQLLDGNANIEKKDKYFKEWLDENYNDIEKRDNYMKKNLIPRVNLEFNNFKEFLSEREDMIRTYLKPKLL